MKGNIEHLTAHRGNKSRIYVTSAEILALPSVGNDTVFAVTAPQGTTLSVPNPEDAPDGYRYRYRVFPAIKVHLIVVVSSYMCRLFPVNLVHLLEEEGGERWTQEEFR